MFPDCGRGEELLFAVLGWLIPGLYLPGEGGFGSGYAAIIADAWRSYDVLPIFFLIGGVYLVHWVLQMIWEKMHFALGFEWFISKTANILVPAKRKERQREGFFKTSRLDPKKNLDEVEYIDIIPPEKLQHADLVDSRLAARFAWVGLVIPPMAVISLGITKTAMKTEGENKYSKRGFTVSIIGICIASVLFLTFCLIPGFQI